MRLCSVPFDGSGLPRNVVVHWNKLILEIRLEPFIESREKSEQGLIDLAPSVQGERRGEIPFPPSKSSIAAGWVICYKLFWGG